MNTFPQLLKKIREQSGLTQSELAKVLGVSTVLISMLEIGQKEPSKAFVIKLADKLGVRPGSIMPFIFLDDDSVSIKHLPGPEKALVSLGEKLQNYLITEKAKKLKQYV